MRAAHGERGRGNPIEINRAIDGTQFAAIRAIWKKTGAWS
jgi:hypothetical protein